MHYVGKLRRTFLLIMELAKKVSFTGKKLYFKHS